MIDIPEMMTAISIEKPGGPEVLVPEMRAVPSPAHDEVLIKVEAAGVNGPDIMQRSGTYPPPPGASDIPGLELAGTIVALGSGVTRHAQGDRVCALVTGGGYAEYAVAHEMLALPCPTPLTLTQAAGIPETYFTVWANVFDRGGLKSGEIFVVHGGASGIGTTAIQLASLHGARVFTTSGTPEKCKACEELGAERAINYRDEDFEEVVREATGGYGADLVLDMVGGEYIARNMSLLARDGRLVNIAYRNGPVAKVNFLPIMLKRLTMTGSTLRPRSVEEKTIIAEKLTSDVWPLLGAGRVAPIIDKTFPLVEAAAAHTYLEKGEHFGKVILTMS